MQIVPSLGMRQLRGRPRLYDLNRRRPKAGQGLEAMTGSPPVSRMGTLASLEDLLLDVPADRESEWDAVDLYSGDLPEIPH